jgi:hypothetical protein
MTTVVDIDAARTAVVQALADVEGLEVVEVEAMRSPPRWRRRGAAAGQQAGGSHHRLRRGAVRLRAALAGRPAEGPVLHRGRARGPGRPEQSWLPAEA